jgi:DNA-directed RNA polymerase alpha subunit
MRLKKHLFNLYRFPNKRELEEMTNEELFYIANRSPQFKKVMIELILSTSTVEETSKIRFDVLNVGLSERLKNILLQNDFHYLSDLTFIRKSDLLLFKNMGKMLSNELNDVMDQYGLKFADEELKSIRATHPVFRNTINKF